MRVLEKSILLVLTSSAILLANPTAKEKFERADLNKDRVLSIEEFYASQAKKMEKKIAEGRALKGASTAPSFESVDANSDTKITFKEYDKFHAIRAIEMKKIRNKNAQGANSRGIKLFNKYDYNQDGVIDKSEFRDLYLDIKRDKNYDK